MKKEEDSSVGLDASTSNMKLNKNLSKEYGKDFAFDPFEELGIQPNKSDPADR
jgi:hypothetical protein